MLRKLFLSLILSAMVPLGLLAYTTVSGDVSGQTWAGGIIFVQSTVSVGAGTNLTIQPGTIVKFALGTGMNVMGGLIANGSASGQIVFTSWLDDGHGGDSNGDGFCTNPSPNDWSGIGIGNASAAPQIQHCTFLYGAYATGWMLNITGTPSGYVRYSEFYYGACSTGWIHPQLHFPLFAKLRHQNHQQLSLT